jgi:hypothetical protein
MKNNISICFSIVLLVVAFWLGEEGKGLFQIYPYMLGVIGLRAILGDYKDKNSNFPETLQELHIKLPCSRVLRGTILKYVKTETGYRIWFEDWLVEHSATESIPFTAHK